MKQTLKIVNQEAGNDEELEEVYRVIQRNCTGAMKTKLKACEKMKTSKMYKTPSSY